MSHVLSAVYSCKVAGCKGTLCRGEKAEKVCMFVKAICRRLQPQDLDVVRLKALQLWYEADPAWQVGHYFREAERTRVVLWAANTALLPKGLLAS